MPLYEFKCFNCEKVVTLNIPVSARNDAHECEECGGVLIRRVSRTAAHFKGSGWTPKFGSK